MNPSQSCEVCCFFLNTWTSARSSFDSHMYQRTNARTHTHTHTHLSIPFRQTETETSLRGIVPQRRRERRARPQFRLQHAFPKFRHFFQPNNLARLRKSAGFAQVGFLCCRRIVRAVCRLQSRIRGFSHSVLYSVEGTGRQHPTPMASLHLSFPPRTSARCSFSLTLSPSCFLHLSIRRVRKTHVLDSLTFPQQFAGRGSRTQHPRFTLHEPCHQNGALCLDIACHVLV